MYKYFPSLHAVYDALFARGLELNGAAIGLRWGGDAGAAIRASGQALVRWAVENPALGQLLYWRPVPGFAPTVATFDVSERQVDQLRAAFAAAARAGQLHPSAASDEAPRLFTIVLSGLISQQMANEPARTTTPVRSLASPTLPSTCSSPGTRPRGTDAGSRT